MRLFAYYALHSFVNQLRKLFKTWVLIFLAACMVLGGVIGFGVATLEDAAEERDEEKTEEAGGPEEQRPSFFEEAGLDRADVIELAVGAALLALFVFEAYSADKNGSKIFLPADVNLLFASPMKPQSVLMFRLMTQLGTALVLGVYLLFQLPNLTLNLGLGLWAALGMIAAFCLAVATGKLLQVLLYLLCAERPRLKENLHRILYALLALLLGGYLLYWKTGGGNPLQAAAGFFNAPASRLIPLWGWLKGFCLFAAEGDAALALLSLAACAAGVALLVWAISLVKADFYEDAMAKSEETAELLERAREEKGGGVSLMKRKKDRSDKLRRDAMGHGAGASVFFYKSLYNRFRFAHLGVFTKTAETYLAAAIGVSLLCRFVFETEPLLPVALTLSGLAFFRSMGNPLSQDTDMDFFVLIPESMWAKLFSSLLGGTVNCLLDLLPAMLAAVLLGAEPLPALAWLPFIVSVDFYATCVGTFINLSVPVSAGKTVKQIVQIMFVYFGLLPDIAVMAVGLVFDRAAAAAIGAAAINIALGLVFFFLSPLFLEPKGGTLIMPEENAAVDLKAAKKHFSRLGLGVFVYLAATAAAQILAQGVAAAVDPEWAAKAPWLVWVLTFAPQYLVGVPLGLLVLRKAPAAPRGQQSLGAGRWIVIAIISIFMMYAGSIVGTIITSLLGSILGDAPVNPLLSYAMDDSLPLKILFIAILAPLIEEYVFRKQLIDRMNVYGEKLAVVTSAVIFGLIHGNLSQFFYAFALGLVFGYVYLKTGRLRYSTALHMCVNLLGSVVAPALLSKAGLDTLQDFDPTDAEAVRAMLTPGMVGFVCYVLAMIVLAIAGLVLLCVKSRKVSFELAPQELPKGSRFGAVCLNVGMVLLFLASLAMIASTMIL